PTSGARSTGPCGGRSATGWAAPSAGPGAPSSTGGAGCAIGSAGSSTERLRSATSHRRMPRVASAVALAAAIVLPSCALLRHDGPPAPVVQIDLNSASLRSVERLPGVTPSMARRIVDGRPYAAPEDLVERGILTSRELDRVADRVTVRERR